MTRLTDTLNSAAQSPPVTDELHRLFTKMASFTTVPLNAKHAARMAPFATPEMAAFLAAELPKCVMPLSCHPSFGRDVIVYFYAAALLAESATSAANDALEQIAGRMIAEDYPKRQLLHRVLGFYKKRPDIAPIWQRFDAPLSA